MGVTIIGQVGHDVRRNCALKRDRDASEALAGVQDARVAMDSDIQGENTDSPDTVEGSEKEAVNLEKMADDYAKYLIVNSKQDVSVVAGQFLVHRAVLITSQEGF